MTGILALATSVILGVGLALWFLKHHGKVKRTREEVVTIIESFINGTGEEWGWDDFISIPVHDPELEKIRVRCARLPEEYPPDKSGTYCNEKGLEVLRNFVGKKVPGSEGTG